MIANTKDKSFDMLEATIDSQNKKLKTVHMSFEVNIT